MGSISKLGLDACRACPSRFCCIMTPTKNEHDSDMESWVFYILSGSKLAGLHSSNFKCYNELVEAPNPSQYTCISGSSEPEINGPTLIRIGSRWQTLDKQTISFRLYIATKFQEELSGYAYENYPRLRDVVYENYSKQKRDAL